MSGAKHTPGPWAADVMFDVNDDQGYLIACVHAGEASAGSPSGGDDIAQANAALISAAPDLLALAQLVHGSFGGGLVMTFTEADVAAFDAAIAKVEGRS